MGGKGSFGNTGDDAASAVGSSEAFAIADGAGRLKAAKAFKRSIALAADCRTLSAISV